MRINPFVYGFLVIGLFFGIIFGFQSQGIWSISGKITSDGNAVQPLESDVNSIKGWMTLEQITTTYNVPLLGLLAQFQLPADTPPDTAIKDLESDLFSVTNLRNWLEHGSQEGTTSQTGAAVSTPVIQATPETVQPTPEAIQPEVTAHIAPERAVTGKTTFQELLDWGVSEKTIQKIIGGDLPALSTIIKDFITEKGLAFSGLKTSLQEEVDKANQP
jgi:hypothetical protein